MKKKSLSPIERTTLLGFAVALSILFGVGAMSVLFLRETEEDTAWVEHSHRVIENLQSCLLDERNMENSARSFVLTGAVSSVDYYRTNVERLSRSLATIERLTWDNPSQQRQLQLLRPLVDQRLTMLSTMIDAREKSGQQAAIAVLFQHKVLVLINEIHHVIDEMQTAERSLLKIRIEEHARSSRRLQTLIFLGSAAAIVFLSAASFLIHADVTARQRIEEDLRQSQARLQRQTEELQESNRELESFSYSVSHDLRAPLRGIEGFSQLILENYNERLDEEGRGYFSRISAAAKRMGFLIDEILELSRITRIPLQSAEVDLAVLARSAAEELRKSDPSRHVTWKIPDSLVVRGDAALLGVALSNLLGNAWKFTSRKPDGNIELGKIVQDDKPVYFVRDNGAGFDRAYESKLFQPFQRLHSPKEFPGTGIGLATVARVIRRHGGHVWAQGVVDQGAVFFFTLS